MMDEQEDEDWFEEILSRADAAESAELEDIDVNIDEDVIDAEPFILDEDAYEAYELETENTDMALPQTQSGWGRMAAMTLGALVFLGLGGANWLWLWHFADVFRP